MGNYAILDDGLPYSSLTGQGLAALGLWALVLATKDRDGITSLTPEVVARLTREPLAIVQEKWSILTGVDAESRNPAEDGRRLVQLADGRWKVVSNELYRERHTGAERRRAQNREAQRRHRAKGGDADVAEAGQFRKPETGGAGHRSGAQATPPHADAGVGRVVEPRVRVVGLDGKPRETPAYQPTAEYPTQEAWNSAVSETRRLQSEIEGATGRTVEAVFAAAADYPGAGAMKTRPETCSAPRLERTLVTLREWWRAITAEGLSGDAAWNAKPRIGTSKPVQRHKGQVDMGLEALKIMQEWDEADATGGGAEVGAGNDRSRGLLPS